MNKHIKTPTVSRRTFLAGTGLTFAITLVPGVFGKAGQAFAADGANPVGAWVTIGTDNSITISSVAAEMGQGTMTGLLQVFADEMDADWSKVVARAIPADGATFGNANGALSTAGSNGLKGNYDKVRTSAAAVRKVLIKAAADKWGVPTDDIITEASTVIHLPTMQRMTYGEIASFATVPNPMPTVDKSELKPVAKFGIVGNGVPRLDIPAKTNGTAMFGMDVRIPNMVYATILRSPVEGTKPLTVDDSALKKIPGFIKTIKLNDTVAIVGESVEAVFNGRNALKVTWSQNDFSKYDSEKALLEFAADAKDLSKAKTGQIFGQGDVDKTFADAGKVIKADYTTDYVYHAGMEPINITAYVSPAKDSAEIWMGTQSQTSAQAAAAAYLKIKPEMVKVNQHFLGGGFGRRTAADMVPDVIAVSIDMQRPVKMIWTRETDIKAAKLRPMTAQHLEAAFDGAGKLVGWRHRIAAEAVSGYPDPSRFNTQTGLDGLVANGAKIDYPIPAQATDYVREIRGAPLSAWRGIGAGHNKFAIEGFMDELASAQKVDPIEWRLKNLTDPRGQAVIKAVAEMAGWGTQPPAGRARGVSIGFNVASWTAMIVEISADKSTGLIKVHKVWNAIDPGLAVNPEMIKQQCESCVIFGLSAALRERVTFKNGVIQQNNLFDYRVARMSDMPEIETKVMPTPNNAPGGIGEAQLPNLAPAIANAFFVLTGARLRQLPFTPDRVKAALNQSAV